jgi:hypothetical protein
MDTTRLSGAIRASFEAISGRTADDFLAEAAAAEPSLGGLDLAGITAVTRDTINTARRDAVCGAVVRRYQEGPRDVWGPVLLEMLAPALVTRARQFKPVPPAICIEDIEQQLIFELLSLASQESITSGSRWVDQRLVLGAGKKVSRWIRRAVAQQAESLEQHLELEHSTARPEFDELEDLVGGQVSRADVHLVYTAKVRGHSLREVALRSGIPYKTLLDRVRRARLRLAEGLAA